MLQQGWGVSLVCCVLLAAPSAAGDWPQRRGPGRDGVVAESSGWDGKAWGLGDPLWNGEFGAGASSPLVFGSRLYVMGRDGERDRLYCVDAASGETLWTVGSVAPEYGRFSTGDKGLYSGVTATPELDARTEYIYTLSNDGELTCRDTRREGQRVWRVNLYDELDVGQRPKIGRSGLRDYGYTSSPLVWRRWVIVEAGSKQGNLIAFHKLTGRRVWASENVDPAGHTAGPVPLEVDGVPCVAVLTHRGLLVARLDGPRAGETVAEYPWETSFANNVVAPAVHGDRVLITSAYNHSSMHLLKISLDGASKVWERPHASKVCTPVIHDAHVCWAWGKLHCLDLASGAQRWEGGDFGDAGSVLATSDGRLIVWGKRGKLTLVEGPARSPRSYLELAEVDRSGQADAWPHPALADGRIYVKDRAGRLSCFELERPGRRIPTPLE